MVLLFALVTMVSFGQVDISTLNDFEKKIVKTFKETYVDKTFKDPYSFKLLKLEITPKTFGDWSLDNLNFCKKQIEIKDFRVQPKQQYLDDVAKYEKEYSEMSEELKKTIKAYKVRIDCYGNNSYGNPILGKYEFNYVIYSGMDLSNPITYGGDKKPYVSELK